MSESSTTFEVDPFVSAAEEQSMTRPLNVLESCGSNTALPSRTSTNFTMNKAVAAPSAGGLISSLE